MRRVVGTMFVLLLMLFALPALYMTIMHLLVPVIIFTFFIGLGIFLVQRRRKW